MFVMECFIVLSYRVILINLTKKSSAPLIMIGGCFSVCRRHIVLLDRVFLCNRDVGFSDRFHIRVENFFLDDL